MCGCLVFNAASVIVTVGSVVHSDTCWTIVSLCWGHRALNRLVNSERVTLDPFNPRERKLNTNRGHGRVESAC